MLFDSHAHYDDEKFDGIRDDILSSLPQNGIGYILNAGVNISSSEKSRLLAEKYSFVYFAAGIHPSDTYLLKDDEDTMTKLRELLSHPKAVALGEIGLDYHYDFSPVASQQRLFDLQLSLAEELSVPVIVHDREAHGDCMKFVSSHQAVKGVFHSFSGSIEMAKELIKRDWYISFTGVITFKNAYRISEVVRSVPIERILLETDSPYLTPHPHRGKLNSSLYLRHTAEKVAEIKDISYEEVCKITAENACELFGIM